MSNRTETRKEPGAPRRVVLERTKGYRKPEGAIVVTRASKHYGNPFRVGRRVFEIEPRRSRDRSPGLTGNRVNITHRLAVELYRAWVNEHPELLARIRTELAGKDLACFCKLGEPCHADVLLELAHPVSVGRTGVDFNITPPPTGYWPAGGPSGFSGVIGGLNMPGSGLTDASVLVVAARNEADRIHMQRVQHGRGR